MNKNLLKLNKTVIIIVFLAIMSFISVIKLQEIEADFVLQQLEEKPIIIQGNTISAISDPSLTEYYTTQKFKVIVTAYSSTVDQTDSTPFITASGTYVKQGIVAANFLPFGAKVRLPEIYGDKIFTVEDRMHPRKKYQVDIWFPSRQEALNFGAKTLELEIVQES